MFCPNCGQQLNDNALFCPNCGTALAAAPQNAPAQQPQQPVYQQPQQPQQQAYQQAFQQPQQPQQQDYQQPQQPVYQQPQQQAYQQPYAYGDAAPVVAKKRSGKKGLIAVGCIALAALVGGGIWFLSRASKSDNKLLKAAANSFAELKDYTESLPNLHTILENAEQIAETKKAHTVTEIENTLSYSYGDQEMSYGSVIKLTGDVDYNAMQGKLTGSYAMYDTEIPFSLYWDKDQIQAASSALLDQDTLMVPLKDFGKTWNASALSKLLEVKLPEELDLSFSSGDDIKDSLDETLAEVYGEEWAKLRDSFEVKEMEGSTHFTQDGTVYTLNWDRDTLKTMYNKTDEDLDALFDIDNPEDLAKLDLNDAGAKVIIKLLGTVSEALKDQQFLVQDGNLTGLWLSVEMNGDPVEFELLLCGEKNPWEHVTLSVTEDYGRYTVTDTYDVVLEKGDGQLRLKISYSEKDSDEDEADVEGPFTVIYNDADGRISFEMDGEPVEGGPEITLVPVDGGYSFTSKQVVDDSFYQQKSIESFTVTGKVEAISPLSANPRNLLQLTEEELNKLMEDIEQRADDLG